MNAQPPDLKDMIPEGWTGKLPPCLVQVNREGELLHNGAPIIHPAILETFFSSVHYEDGIYLLRAQGQECQLEVADTFFVVRGVREEPGGLRVTLNDGSSESLDLDSLRIGQGDVIYCQVKEGVFPARFLRPAYYQLAQWIIEEGEGFVLVVGSRRVPLRPEG